MDVLYVLEVLTAAVKFATAVVYFVILIKKFSSRK